MDRALLERMLGAAVLVLLFVVFVPALLDGRDDTQSGANPVQGSDGKRTEVIVLNGPREADSGADEIPPETPATRLPDPPAAPQQVSASKASDAGAAKSAAAGSRADDALPAQTASSMSPRAASKTPPAKGFAVQLGSFGSRDNAVGFASGLSSKGYAVFVVRGSANAAEIYRVYAGPRPTRPEAETLAAKLKGEGQAVLVVDLEARAGG